MTNRERNVLILVLAILASCGLVTLISPSPAEPGARATPDSTQPAAASTKVPTATSTLGATHSPAATNTRAPTSTPAPTNTPSPAQTSTKVAAGTSLLTGTPAAALPLAMDWVLVQKGCVSDAQWLVEFWITGTGGTGEYTFYRDGERLHGPARVDGFAYQVYTGTGSAAEGTFIVESGAQRVRSEFWVERLDCGSPALQPTPGDPPTPGAAVSPLDPGSSS